MTYHFYQYRSKYTSTPFDKQNGNLAIAD